MISLSQLLVNELRMANDQLKFKGKSVGKFLERVFLFNQRGSIRWEQSTAIHLLLSHSSLGSAI